MPVTCMFTRTPHMATLTDPPPLPPETWVSLTWSATGLYLRYNYKCSKWNTLCISPLLCCSQKKLKIHNELNFGWIFQVLELGIVVHSVIIGISLGASQSPATIKPLLVALSFHQFFEGMGLGGCISQVNSNYTLCEWKENKIQNVYKRNKLVWCYVSISFGSKSFKFYFKNTLKLTKIKKYIYS